MDVQTDERMYRQTYRYKNGCTDGCKDGQTYV
jgi:hypothetical protein